MIQTKGGAPKPDLDIDWRGRSEAMHGRAQQAEGALLKMMRRFMIMQAGVSLESLVKGLNALGVTPRDMISILQSIKAAGALQADIEVL